MVVSKSMVAQVVHELHVRVGGVGVMGVAQCFSG